MINNLIINSSQQDEQKHLHNQQKDFLWLLQVVMLLLV